MSILLDGCMCALKKQENRIEKLEQELEEMRQNKFAMLIRLADLERKVMSFGGHSWGDFSVQTQ